MVWGMALSGGGILGAAHLGVLAELDAMDLRPAVLAGTSAGGLVALALAAGVGLDDLTAFGADVARRPLEYFSPQVVRLALELLPWDPEAPATGLIDPSRFIQALARLAGATADLTSLRLPCAVPSVDLRALEAVAFVGGLGDAPVPRPDGWQMETRAPIATALWATMAEPGLFVPLDAPPRLFVDGGVADTLPVDWARRLGADRILAVNVAAPAAPPRRFDILSVLERSEAYAIATLSALRERPSDDVLVLAPDTSGVGFPGLSAYPRLVEAGRQVVRQEAAAIRRFLTPGTPGQEGPAAG